MRAVPTAEKNVKVPAWMNDVLYYHNRGNTTFIGRDSTMGDFVGLDDLMTEDPCVVQGFIDVYRGWIDRFGIDGYRIDTARHVNPEFWQVFAPAITRTQKPKAFRISIFSAKLAASGWSRSTRPYTRGLTAFPAMLDFVFRRVLSRRVAGTPGPTCLRRCSFRTRFTKAAKTTARSSPRSSATTTLAVSAAKCDRRLPDISDDEILQRVFWVMRC